MDTVIWKKLCKLQRDKKTNREEYIKDIQKGLNFVITKGKTLILKREDNFPNYRLKFIVQRWKTNKLFSGATQEIQFSAKYISTNILSY